MGAADVGGILRGTEAEACKELLSLIETSLYEDGHSYSGAIGMVDGITRIKKHFASVALAYEWLEENTEKWGPALVVTAHDSKSDETVFVYGACCSS